MVFGASLCYFCMETLNSPNASQQDIGWPNARCREEPATGSHIKRTMTQSREGSMNGMTERQSKYKIAWLPGDGIGVDVLDATKIVLEKLKLNAEYIHGDIGWEFWCKEGDASPAAHH